MKKITVTLALILIAASLNWATTVRPMSIERLTSAATAIVEAHAIQTWSEWDAAHTRIYTFTRLNVTKTLKGAQASTVLVKQPGGIKDGIKETVYGVRHFSPGEDAFLFLEPAAENDGSFRVVGLMQGNFLVYKDGSGGTQVTNGAPQVTTLNSQGQLQPYSGSRMTLQQLESHVAKAVAQ